MTFEEWAATVGRGVTINPQMAFAAGAASRDSEIVELVAALEQLTTYDCRPSNIWKFFYPSSTGDYVNLIEFREKLAAALARVRKP